jgi:hypothetical protein
MIDFKPWHQLQRQCTRQGSIQNHCFFIFAGFSFLLLLVAPTQARQKEALSDEDILDPNKLIFNRIVPLVDSFDGTQVGTVFVTKRSILGHPIQGICGETCTSYPHGTEESDASYLYVFQKKGECVIGVRGIGWGYKVDRYVNGKAVEIGRLRHQSLGVNIKEIFVNGVRIGPPTNLAKLGPPNGTNSKYFPRMQKRIARSVWTFLNHAVCGLHSTIDNPKITSPGNCEVYSSTNEGYITDIHYFPARQLIKDSQQGTELLVELPNWQPSRHLISGKVLEQLRKLTGTCESD